MCAETDGLGANEQLLKGGKTYRPTVLNNNNKNIDCVKEKNHNKYAKSTTTQRFSTFAYIQLLENAALIAVDS